MSTGPYYVSITGPAGRVTYLEELGTGNYAEVDDYRRATPYPTEDAACDACDRADQDYLRGQRVVISVCSTDEFEGE